MKYHYAVTHNRKHNTLTKLPVKIHLEREMIQKLDDLQNGSRLRRMSLYDCGSRVNKI